MLRMGIRVAEWRAADFYLDFTTVRLLNDVMNPTAYPSLSSFLLSSWFLVICQEIDAHTAKDRSDLFLVDTISSDFYIACVSIRVPPTNSLHNVRQIARRIERQDLDRR